MSEAVAEGPPDTFIWRMGPSSLARDVSERFAGRAHVLDLGCGEGRDSIFLAGRGHEVIGLELSLDGLRKAARLGVSGLDHRAARGGVNPLRPGRRAPRAQRGNRPRSPAMSAAGMLRSWYVSPWAPTTRPHAAS
jgi:SAM-dependent methyltransferase